MEGKTSLGKIRGWFRLAGVMSNRLLLWIRQNTTIAICYSLFDNYHWIVCVFFQGWISGFKVLGRVVLVIKQVSCILHKQYQGNKLVTLSYQWLSFGRAFNHDAKTSLYINIVSKNVYGICFEYFVTNSNVWSKTDELFYQVQYTRAGVLNSCLALLWNWYIIPIVCILINWPLTSFLKFGNETFLWILIYILICMLYFVNSLYIWWSLAINIWPSCCWTYDDFIW